MHNLDLNLSTKFLLFLFPTQVRANAIGICSMTSRIGGIISPVFLSLYDVVSWLPGVLFGGFAIAAGVLSFWFPETLGVPMLMNFDDAEKLYTGQYANKYEVDASENQNDHDN